MDTETFDDYHTAGLHGDPDLSAPVPLRHFSPPILTKTWFHQGPVGEEFGDWEEIDYTHEYWQGDPQLLEHTKQVNDFLRTYNDRGNRTTASPRNRRIKRDALRTLRGSILRSELYARDGSHRQDLPYTVTEHAYNLTEIAAPTAADQAGRTPIFFPHLIAQRTTQWERGDDPLTQFSFTSYQDEDNDFDAFGRPHQQTMVALPRRADKRRPMTGAVVGQFQPDETRILATHTHIAYASPVGSKYIHDRVAQTKIFELRNPPGPPDAPGDSVQVALGKQWTEARGVHDSFKAQQPGTLYVLGDTINHYDGAAFDGLPVGEVGDRGALVRTETQILNEKILQEAYGDASS